MVGSLVVVRQKYMSSVANKDPGRGRRLLIPWHCEYLEGLLWPSFIWSGLREAGMSEVEVSFRTEQVFTTSASRSVLFEKRCQKYV